MRLRKSTRSSPSKTMGIQAFNDYAASSAFVIFVEPFCFQVTLLHRHPHDTRHRLHTKLLHSLQENHKKSIAFLWPNLPNLYIPRNIHKIRLFDYLIANLELVIFASLAALLLSSVLLYPAVQECATVQLQ